MKLQKKNEVNKVAPPIKMLKYRLVHGFSPVFESLLRKKYSSYTSVTPLI